MYYLISRRMKTTAEYELVEASVKIVTIVAFVSFLFPHLAVINFT